MQEKSLGTIVKNMLTGSVVYLSHQELRKVEAWLNNQNSITPGCIDDLIGDNGIIVPENVEELEVYDQLITDARENKDSFFTLHLLPTMNCQLHCLYCFENGVNREQSMSNQTLLQATKWLSRYFEVNTGISSLRLVFFGGEPLLRKDIITSALPLFSNVAEKYQKEFFCEIITNGELMDEKIAMLFSKYNWKRMQVTLDGNKQYHDKIRFGKNGRPTFDKIVDNIRMVLDRNFIGRIDVRINFDISNTASIPSLISFLAGLGQQKRMAISFAQVNSIISKGCSSAECKVSQPPSNDCVSKSYIRFNRVAQEFGFDIPEEVVAGPLCVATVKHSVVIQPDGNLQKCFCSVGRPDYNFGHVSELPTGYARDECFELFNERTNKCKKQKCGYLPICGGGCVWNAVCLNGGKSGFSKPFCQKSFLVSSNHGLLKLNY